MAQYTYGLTQLVGHGHAFTELEKVANPAAGAGFTYTNKGSYWKLVDSLSFQLVTSGTAGSRLVTLTVNDAGGVALATIVANNSTAASQTAQYTFLRTYDQVTGGANGPFLSLFPSVFLQADFTIKVTIAAEDTGDQVSNIRLYAQQFVTGSEGYMLGVVDTAFDPAGELAQVGTLEG